MIHLRWVAGRELLSLIPAQADGGINFKRQESIRGHIDGLSSGNPLACFLIAAAESYTSYFGGAEWSPMVAFIILILALLFRPQGILGKGLV